MSSELYDYGAQQHNAGAGNASPIASCKSRGIKVAAYCLRHQIKPSNYYYWQNKLQPQPAGKFIPITPAPATAPVSIIFTRGTRICFENMPPVDYVKNLLN
ncbi:IS66 family insertion sequence element accessory protein TnpA [Ferruginibacter sp.]|uniref:IS66 family insertion sequence element accessory protein TnpA n=1 Tax=Ferruginibacter sp. TaxID=1940288 RepID=UPI00374D254E